MPNIQPSTVIIGGAGGIGRCLAARLRSAGAQVLIIGRDPRRTAEAAADLGVDHVLTDAQDGVALSAAITSWGKPVEALVNLAGSILLKPAHLTRDGEWQDTLAQNLTTAFNTVRIAGQTASCTTCVLMSSAAARIGLPNHEAIAAAKAGVEGLVRSAAATYAPRLTVNAVAPGLVDTPLASRITAVPAAKAASERMHPLGRLGRPDEIAAAIAWLVGPDARWMTGEILAIDGGLSRVRRS